MQQKNNNYHKGKCVKHVTKYLLIAAPVQFCAPTSNSRLMFDINHPQAQGRLGLVVIYPPASPHQVVPVPGMASSKLLAPFMDSRVTIVIRLLHT